MKSSSRLVSFQLVLLLEISNLTANLVVAVATQFPSKVMVVAEELLEDMGL
jgi:hypothetical protein